MRGNQVLNPQSNLSIISLVSCIQRNVNSPVLVVHELSCMTMINRMSIDGRGSVEVSYPV